MSPETAGILLLPGEFCEYRDEEEHKGSDPCDYVGEAIIKPFISLSVSRHLCCPAYVCLCGALEVFSLRCVSRSLAVSSCVSVALYGLFQASLAVEILCLWLPPFSLSRCLVEPSSVSVSVSVSSFVLVSAGQCLSVPLCVDLRVSLC